MSRIKRELKALFLILGLGIYIALLVGVGKLGYADPSGAIVTNLSTETYSVSPTSRTDLGGTITTVDLSTTMQDTAWKAYVGNITGTLVLKNSDGWSIFEWWLNSSSFTGNVFVSRNGSVSWDDIMCANNTIIGSEQNFLGMDSTDSDNINKTFNWTAHKSMTISGVGTITNGTCPSAATYINGTYQTINQDTTKFQEILLYDKANLVYATFIDQNSWGYDNNASVNSSIYDFQLIVAENNTAQTGTTYYFYADIAS
ncbi:MAG TPA: hypothetical protein VJ461_05240 [Candidatus Nanoarchaeia archaeon]|nr:hypothetical protein [Candidatus Nanoarchaeia archaeon]